MTLGFFGTLVLAAASFATSTFAETPGPTPTPARIAFPGGLDRSFGTGGNAPELSDVIAIWEAVAIESDGKIVVAGREEFGDRMLVARYDSDGRLDATFGDGGLVIPVLPFGGRARAVALTKRDDIVVAGVAYHDPLVDHTSDAVVIRLDTDGAPDRKFGARGVVTLDLGENDEAAAVIVRDDGGLVVLAQTNGSGIPGPAGAGVVIGLREDGKLELTFGHGGMTRIAGSAAEGFDADGMVAEPNGRFVVAFSSFMMESGNELRILRFDGNGNVVRTFEILSGFAAGIARLTDGTIVVDGAAASPDTGVSAAAALLRFDDAGNLDRRFGDHGIIGSTETRPGKIAVDARGRIVVAADELTRHFEDGVLDVSFGVDGVAVDSAIPAFHDVALQRDGKIVAVGGFCFSSPKTVTECRASVARYESDRTQLCGDADANGTFTVTDGVAALRGAAGFADGCDQLVCDVDGSGAVTVTDGVNVLRAAAGLSATLHCGIP